MLSKGQAKERERKALQIRNRERERNALQKFWECEHYWTQQPKGDIVKTSPPLQYYCFTAILNSTPAAGSKTIVLLVFLL